MKTSVFSAHWYRVADLHPRLRTHVQVDRHCYRGEIWHVIKDPLTARQHRVNQSAYQIVGMLDGRLSVQQIWDRALERQGDDAPTQSEVITLLSQLYQAELIAAEASPDVEEVFERRDSRERRVRSTRMNPLAFRVALFDPTPFLEAFAPLGELLLKRWALAAWAICVLLGLVSAATHWGELGAYASQNLTAPRMLLIMWLAYPLIKAVHEFAHGIAVRVWGGEVHEMGVTLLVLTPVPYVDASAASGFRSKTKRIAVSLVGIGAELMLAAIAAWIWVNASDGIVREAAFATMLIGGVSTVLFNGNPLMRFDAYYALADLLEIPGLAARGNALVAWYADRRLLGSRSPQPATSRGEKGWLVAYAIASFVYRWFVSIAIVLWLAQLSLAMGMLAFAFIFWRLVGTPLVKLAKHLMRSPALDLTRRRAYAVSGAIGAIAVAFAFAVPMPFSTSAQGVVWVPEQANIRAQIDGFVDQVLARDGESVAPGQPIVVMREPRLLADWVKAQARLAALDAAFQAVLVRNPAEARRIEGEIKKTEGDIGATAERLARLTVRAEAPGKLSLPRAQDLPGAFVAKGTLLAHALSEPQVRVRVALSQSDVSLVRDRTRSVEVRLADSVSATHPARLMNETPAATRELPSAALGDRVGGPFKTEVADPDGLHSAEPVFIVDLAVDSHALQRVGGRVWVRFDHGSEPLAFQLWRRTQQVFLRLLGGDHPLPMPRA